jgi:hypothetical protein
MYEISKERLLQIAKDSAKSKVKVKQWYPDVFDFKEGWYKIDNDISNYVLYLKDEDQRQSYGTMNGDWCSSLGLGIGWSKERLDDEGVINFLIKAGIDNRKINPETNTTLWVYNKDEDKITNGEGLVMYLKGVWYSTYSEVSISNVWEGEGWYKFTWTFNLSPDAEGYIYLRSVEGSEGYGFYNGEYRNAVYTALAKSICKCNIDEIKTLMINEAIRRNYNEQNIISLGGDSCFDSDINKWSFYTDVLYTADVGCGGMIAYKHGVWALKTT